MLLCAQIGVAKADLYPAFSLSGSFGFLASDVGQFQLGDLTLPGKAELAPWGLLSSGMCSITGSLPTASGCRTPGSRRPSSPTRTSCFQAQKEVENGLVSFLNTQEQVVSLTEAANAAKLSLDLAMVQYTEGMTDFTTVLTAQQNLLGIRTALGRQPGGGAAQPHRHLSGAGRGLGLREGTCLIPAETRETMEKRTNWGGLWRRRQSNLRRQKNGMFCCGLPTGRMFGRATEEERAC